jgi:F-type H+-transporting ATPase subunit epsilon
MIHFELVTLDGTKFGEDVYEVVLPTPQGYIGIFPNHMPLVSIATPGVIAIRRSSTDPDSKLEYFATNGGVIEILENQVRVLADEADREDEINEAEVQKAFDRAEKLRAEAKSQVEIDQAQSLMDRQAVRLQVAGLRRRHRDRR